MGVKLTEGGTWIRVDTDYDTLELLRSHLRYQTPDYWRSAQYVLYKKTKGKRGWDGYIKLLQKVPRRPGTGLILRGFKKDLLEKCRLFDLEMDTSGLVKSPFAGLTEEDVPDDLVASSFTPDPAQKRCVALWLSHGMGIHRATVSFGKTVTFCMAASMIKRHNPKARFLYLVSTERLMRQLVVETRKFLPDWDISQFGGGDDNMDGEDMVIGMTAMMNRYYDDLLANDWFKSFSGLLADESHHAASASLERIIKAVPAYFKLGASDSLKEHKIDKKMVIKGLLGPKLFEATAAPLIKSGRIAKPHIYLIDIPEWQGKYEEIPHRQEPDSEAWVLNDGEWKKGLYVGPVIELDKKKEPVMDKNGNVVTVPNMHLIQLGKDQYEVPSTWCLVNRTYDRAIIRFKHRNELITQWVKHFHDNNLRTVVVCTRTLHVYILSSLLSEVLGPDKVRTLYGTHSSKDRDATFEWFKTTPCSVMVTPLVKEGVSINEIEGLVVADHVADWEVANQIIGRAIRQKTKSENRASIVWFVDRQHSRLRRNSAKVLQNLKEIEGYTFHHPCSTPDQIAEATATLGGKDAKVKAKTVRRKSTAR